MYNNTNDQCRIRTYKSLYIIVLNLKFEQTSETAKIVGKVLSWCKMFLSLTFHGLRARIADKICLDLRWYATIRPDNKFVENEMLFFAKKKSDKLWTEILDFEHLDNGKFEFKIITPQVTTTIS